MVKVNWQVAAAAEVDLTELFRGSKSHGYRFQVQAGICKAGRWHWFNNFFIIFS